MSSNGRVRVAVLMGGRSSEHDISVASAQSVVAALDPGRYEVVTVEIARDGTWALPSASDNLSQATLRDPEKSAITRESERHPALPEESDKLSQAGRVSDNLSQAGVDPALPIPAAGGRVTGALADVDVVLPILHGPFGEDGTVQGLLELANVPYVGAGVAASSLCMDKDLMKAVLRDRGIPVARNIVLRDGDAPRNPFGYPVFVKPARLGSSVGISKARDDDELRDAVEVARRHDDKVLVEELVDGIEVEVGVLGNRQPPPIASLPGEIVAHGFSGTDWYDYSAKYDEGGMDLIVPPRIPDEAVARVQEVAVDAFVATECEGMARVDCFVRTDGEVLVNELNTIPGFTATSVYAKLFEASGIPYPELLDRLIALAFERHERRAKLVF